MSDQRPLGNGIVFKGNSAEVRRYGLAKFLDRERESRWAVQAAEGRETNQKSPSERAQAWSGRTVSANGKDILQGTKVRMSGS